MPVDSLAGSKACVEAKKKQEGNIFYSDGIMTLKKKVRRERGGRGNKEDKWQTFTDHLYVLTQDAECDSLLKGDCSRVPAWRSS